MSKTWNKRIKNAGIVAALMLALAATARVDKKDGREAVRAGRGGTFEWWDANGDGVISRKEFVAPHAGLFSTLDGNRDGRLDTNEFLASDTRQFSRFDKDEDDEVSGADEGGVSGGGTKTAD